MHLLVHSEGRMLGSLRKSLGRRAPLVREHSILQSHNMPIQCSATMINILLLGSARRGGLSRDAAGDGGGERLMQVLQCRVSQVINSQIFPTNVEIALLLSYCDGPLGDSLLAFPSFERDRAEINAALVI